MWSALLQMLSSAFFISFTEFFCSRTSVWFFYMMAIFLFTLFFSCIVFLVLLDCLSVFSCNSQNFLKTAILNSLSARSQNSMSFSLVIGELLLSCSNDMFPWFFTFLGALHCLSHIESGRYLLKSWRIVFRWDILFPGLVVSGAFSDLVWIHLLCPSCSLLGQNF